MRGLSLATYKRSDCCQGIHADFAVNDSAPLFSFDKAGIAKCIQMVRQCAWRAWNLTPDKARGCAIAGATAQPGFCMVAT